MDWTLYIIKPEAFEKREVIKEVINSNENLEITESTICALTKSDLHYLAGSDLGYVNDPKLFGAYSHFMRTGFIEMGIIEGPNAINRFKDICGILPDPKQCPSNSLRNVFGDHEVKRFNEIPFYLNGVHKPNCENDAKYDRALYEELSLRSIEENMKEIALRIYQNPPIGCNPAYKNNAMMLWEKHILPTVNYAKLLAEKTGADNEVVSIAAYCHDRSRFSGDDKNHHILGAKDTEKDLLALGCSSDLISSVSGCIKAHRSKKNPKAKTLEEKVVASADAMSAITALPLLWYSAKSKHGLAGKKIKKKVRKKIKSAFSKLMPEAKALITSEYNKVIEYLDNKV